MHASVIGSGARNAIFLPGVGHYGEDGRAIAEQISTTHTTRLLDIPGTGRSAPLPGIRRLDDVVPHLVAYLDGIGVEALDVIGHSLGGILGLAFACARPERVRSLTLLDSGYWRVPRFPTAIAGPLGVVMPVLDVLHRIVGDRLLVGKPANAHPPGTTIDYDQDPAEVSAAGAGLLLAAYRADPPAMLRRVTVPTLLIYGERPDVPRAWARVQRAVRGLASSPHITARELRGGHDVHRADARTPPVVQDFLLGVA